MTDQSFRLLLPFLRDKTRATLLVADENLVHASNSLISHPNLTVVTNRYDVFRRCEHQGLKVSFSDYQLEKLPAASLEQIVYRVSKEKPVVHHVINQSLRLLQPGAELILSGEKKDGIKTYADKAARLLGHKSPVQKHGQAYLTRIARQSTDDSPQPLDDRDYTQMRPIFNLDSRPVISKPGIFGWDKIDAGSDLLMTVAEALLGNHDWRPESVLDLGCGYGYLTLRTAAWHFLKRRCATDNNAAAVDCMRRNAENFSLEVEVSADDAGAGLDDQFDLILCNPPFHQGFAADSDLTRKFLHSAQRLLSKTGTALFVVNQFIGIEKLAEDKFRSVQRLHGNGKFKVLALRP